jgi:membrane protease YdiL (CAAX protease family)
MKTMIIFLSIIFSLMLIVLIVFFIWGIVILITRKSKIWKYQVKGKSAIAIGWSFIVVPVLLFIIYAILFQALEMGRSGTRNALLTGPLILDIIFITGIICVYSWAISKAKEYQNLLRAKELDP